MEPTQAEMKKHDRYVIFTAVKRMEELAGGWWVQFDGSWESLYFGDEKPPFHVGNIIKITFEKQEPPCQPSLTTNPTNS